MGVGLRSSWGPVRVLYRSNRGLLHVQSGSSLGSTEGLLAVTLGSCWHVSMASFGSSWGPEGICEKAQAVRMLSTC